MDRSVHNVVTCFVCLTPHATGANAQLRVVAVTGETAPGTGGVFDSFDRPVLNNLGQVAMAASFDDGEAIGIWSEGDGVGQLRKVALAGELAPGAGGATFEVFLDTFKSLQPIRWASWSRWLPRAMNWILATRPLSWNLSTSRAWWARFHSPETAWDEVSMTLDRWRFMRRVKPKKHSSFSVVFSSRVWQQRRSTCWEILTMTAGWEAVT